MQENTGKDAQGPTAESSTPGSGSIATQLGYLIQDRTSRPQWYGKARRETVDCCFGKPYLLAHDRGKLQASWWRPFPPDMGNCVPVTQSQPLHHDFPTHVGCHFQLGVDKTELLPNA